MTVNGDFSQLLRHHRSRAGQTQQQLADLAAMSIRAVRDLELGRVQRPRRDTVRLLADALRLTGGSRADFEAAAGHRATVSDLKAIYQSLDSPPPAPLDTLIGREAEVAVVGDLLSSGCQRLVTLTGLTGVGKTRLALEVAGNLHAGSGFPVLWTSTSDHTAPAPGLQQSGQLTSALQAGLDALLARPDEACLVELMTLIGQRPTLIVLDGYRGSSVRVDRIVPLLETCAGVRTLITSPVPFGIRGERAFPLMPLPVPDWDLDYSAGGLETWGCVELMLRHVRQVVPQFRLDERNAPAVAELCHRLDGIPVALAAVASWFLVYEPETLAEYVRADPFAFVTRAVDRDGDTQLRELLRGVIDSLDPLDGSLLSTLAGVERSWSVAEAAGAASVAESDAASVVHHLMALGMLRPLAEDRTRFRVLDLVRFLHQTAVWAARRERDLLRSGTERHPLSEAS